MKVNPNIHILIIDDCAITSKQIRLVLKKKGFKNVQAVDNGADALAEMIISKKQDRAVDLILLDWNMPKLNGMHFLKKIKELPEYADLPIIMVSANDKDEDIQYALQNGAAGYVKKPVIIGDLFNEIGKAMGK